jgi:hypothetical protein
MYILRGRAPRSGLGMVVVLLWLGVMTWQYPYGVAMFIVLAIVANGAWFLLIWWTDSYRSKTSALARSFHLR